MGARDDKVRLVWPEIAVAADILVFARRAEPFHPETRDREMGDGQPDFQESGEHGSEDPEHSEESGSDAKRTELAAYFDILLVKRAYPPFEGCYAIPGGGVEIAEDLPDAARRELMEETGIEPETLAQFRAYGAPGRDPRCRTVSVVYWTIIDREKSSERAGSDAKEIRWFPLLDLPDLAFDHSQVIADAVKVLFA